MLSFPSSNQLNQYLPWLIALLAFVFRLVLFPYSQVTDSDAVSRVIIAEVWLIHPNWILSGVWGPFHTYLNALALFLYNDRVIAPIALHMLFGGLIAVPVYRFTARLFNTNSALVAAIIVAFSPLVVRNSLQPMAEVPYVFFVATCMWFLIRGMQEKPATVKWFIWAGIFLTVAAGMRYEAWVLIALFTLVVLLNKKWKGLVAFWSAAMIFPVSWMVGNYLEYGNFLYSVDYASYYNTVVHGVNDNETILLKIQRLVFFPLSIFHIYPLGLLAVLFPVVLLTISKKQFSKMQMTWLIPFCVMIVVFIYKAMEGTLLMQHRFSITLFLLILPFTAVIIPRGFNRRTLGIVLFIVGLHIGLTEIFQKFPIYERIIPESTLKEAFRKTRWLTFDQLQSVPKLEDDTVQQLLEKTKGDRSSESPLLLDYFGWENTYNYAFNSRVDAEKIVFLTPDMLRVEQSFKELKRYFQYPTSSEQGLIILRQGSGNMKNVITRNGQRNLIFENDFVPIHQMDSVGSIYIFKFDTQFLKRKNNEPQ